ncbi:MAG: hypothetical protein HQ542_11635 [Bacteroidia bacterium]|nr:hypothetical protein [Bacteroidia bacterium]
MENTFNEKESLDLIRQMIGTAKNNLQKGMGNVFLFWGYLVAVISLLTCILLVLLPAESRYYAYYLWFIMALAYPFHYMLIKKTDRDTMVSTYVDRLMTWVWIAFTFSIVTVVVGLLFSTFLAYPYFTGIESGHDFLRWFPWLFMTPFVLCLYGFALFVSGKAYGFKPLYIGGAICWVSALFLLVTIHHTYVLEIQQISLCLCAIAGYIIPGHLLNQMEIADVQRS